MASSKSPRAIARSELVAAIKRVIFPLLENLGFEAMPHEKAAALLVYSWHRAAEGGGYHLLDIVFDAKRRPEFGAMIQVVGTEGYTLPWGAHIPAEKVSASHHLKRIFLQKLNPSIFAKVLPIWIKHIYFGIRPNSDSGAARNEAERVCAEFWQCFPQAEKWWESRVLGPNLFEGELVISKASPPTHPPPEPELAAEVNEQGVFQDFCHSAGGFWFEGFGLGLAGFRCE
jgi:hypothetical protein